MSGNWLIRGTGPAYVVMQQAVRLEPGKTYTLKIKARRFGEGVALGVVQLLQAPGGGIKSGPHPAWQPAGYRSHSAQW